MLNKNSNNVNGTEINSPVNGAGNEIFAKANALGNDFILIKTDIKASEQLNNALFAKERIVKLADRKFGLGADQILSVDPEFSVNIWNTDGSIAKMCGNGLRALGKWIFTDKVNFQNTPFLRNTDILYQASITLKTISGPVTIDYIVNEEFSWQPTCDKNSDKNKSSNNIDAQIIETFEWHKNEFKNSQAQILELQMPFEAKISQADSVYYVDIGNLHKIHIVSMSPENLQDYAHEKYNVSCIWLENGKCHARTWELGTGETLACGSAAFSIASVLEMLGETNLDVFFKHGPLRHRKKEGKIIQAGPAEIICVGSFWL